MKKILAMTVLAAILASCSTVNKCPEMADANGNIYTDNSNCQSQTKLLGLIPVN